jgi:hypothetical protein
VSGSDSFLFWLGGSDEGPINVCAQFFAGDFAAALAFNVYGKGFASATMTAGNLLNLAVRSAAPLSESGQLIFVEGFDKFKEGHAILHSLEQRIATAIELINSICYFFYRDR